MAPPKLRQIRRTAGNDLPLRPDLYTTPYAFAVELKQPAADDGPIFAIVLCPWCGARETQPLRPEDDRDPQPCMSGEAVRYYVVAVPARVPVMAPAAEPLRYLDDEARAREADRR